MKFNFKNLMLCITHDCNGDCTFCMRGEPQKINMTPSIIEKIFSQVNRVEHIGITGGEPSLYPEAIKWIVYYIKHFGCKIGSFFCATNGLIYSNELEKQLMELYKLCEDKEKCEFTFSMDQFHKLPDAKALREYKRLPFYSTSKIKNTIDKADILSEGRAKENGLGRYSMPPVNSIYDYNFNCFEFNIGDRIFVNSYGDVVLDADLSYENQAKRKIGNLSQEDFYEIFKRHFFVIPDHWILEGQKCFYKVRLKSDADTILCDATEDCSYFEFPQEASVAYHSILRNIRIMPMDTTEKQIPDDLELVYKDLPIADDRCIGTAIEYKSNCMSKDNIVTVEVVRCPISEGSLYVGRKN